MKRCLNCDLGFDSVEWTCPACHWEPISLGPFPAFAPELAASNDDYDTTFFQRLAEVEEGYFWFEARNALLAWALRKYFPVAQSFLEIGCGTGVVLRELARIFPHLQLSGGEIFENGLRCAATRVPSAELIQLDATQIPFRDEFDVIGAFDVIEHIEDDEVVLSRLYAAARPGGGVMLTVPQHAFLWSHADDHAHHKRRYERSDLVRKLKLAGFQVDLVTSFVSLLVPVLLAVRVFRGRAENYNVFREFEIGAFLNKTLGRVLALERAGIKAGLRFPVGGSLLIIGKKQLSGRN